MEKQKINISIFFLIFTIIILSSIIPLYNSQNASETEENFEGFEDVPDFFNNFDFGNITLLDDSNYKDFLQKNNLSYIIFYTKWCEQCHIFMPNFVEASNYVVKKKIPLKFAAIDAGNNDNYTQDFEIYGFPSIFLIYNNKKYFYRGIRDKNFLLKFMYKKINNDIFEIQKISELNDYIKNSSFILLSTVKNKNSKIFASFKNYAGVSEDYEFLSCTIDECIKTYNEDIILFKPYDEKINKYSKDFEKIENCNDDCIKNFISKFAIEAGAILNGTQINMLFEHKKKALFYFRDSQNGNQIKYDIVFKELGKDLRDLNIYTFVSDIKNDYLQEEIAGTFNILDNELPCVIFYDINHNSQEAHKSYSLRKIDFKNLNKNYIKNFINDIKIGKKLNDIWSEPPLENNIIDGVKYVVGKTFDKDIIDEKNNVCLILLEKNEECDNCKKYMEYFKKLAKLYEKKNIVFASIDIINNEVRGDLYKESDDLPLIYLYTNNMKNKKVIKYQPRNMTEANIEDLKLFLNEKLEWEIKKENVGNSDL